MITIFISVYIIKNTYGLILLLLYLILNIAYSIKLKHKPIIDVAILVSGFVIRVIYGGCITNIRISEWLFLTIMSLSFYMGLGKRRNELKMHGTNNTRNVLKYYNYNFLDKNMYMCLTLAIVFYSLWSITIDNKSMIYTVPLVLLICMKYSLNVESESEGDPVDVIFHDKTLLIFGALYATVILGILYL